MTEPLTPSELAEHHRFFPTEPPEPEMTLGDFARIVAAAQRLSVALSPSVPAGDVLRPSAYWADTRGIYVLSASGWDTSTPAAFDASWGRPITLADFDARAARSHTRPRPDTDLSLHAGSWRIGRV